MRLENVENSVTIDQMVDKWKSVYKDVRKKSNTRMTVSFEKTRLQIVRKAGEWTVKPHVPIDYWLIFSGIIYVWSLIKPIKSGFISLFPSFFFTYLIGSLSIGLVVYWIYKGLYCIRRNSVAQLFGKQAKV
jgi:hypothetical protein